MKGRTGGIYFNHCPFLIWNCSKQQVPDVAYFFEVAAGFSLRITQPKECAKYHILVKAASTSVLECTQGGIYHDCES